MWPSEVDHIIPIVEGGTSHITNLVHTCHRCNAEKSGRNPALWRAAREHAGKSWPPPDILFTLPNILGAADKVVAQRFLDALNSGYRPMRDAVADLHDRYYDERPRPVVDDLATLVQLTTDYAAAVHP